MDCPICASEHIHSVKGPGRVFFRCDFCGFSWADPASWTGEETNRRGYQHDRVLLSHIIDRALTYPRNPLNVLYCGSSLGVELLTRRGIHATSWDPRFALPSGEAFDLLFCIEAADYFTQPRQDFRSLAKTLKPGGWAFVYSSPVEDDCRRYIFYSKKSLQILASMCSLAFIDQEEGTLTVLRKPLPILVAGGINLDIEGRPYKKLIIRDSNPGKVYFSAGGCARNIAENLSRLGLGTEFVGLVGNDTPGEDLRAASKAAGIGISGLQTLAGKSTSAYLSLLDSRGDMTMAVSGMDIFDAFTPALAAKSLEQAAASAYNNSFGGDPAAPFSKMILDGNLPPETNLFICQRFPDLPCWFDPVSVTKTHRIAAYQEGIFFDRLEGIKLNALEAQALVGDTGPITGDYGTKVKAYFKKVSIVYVTLGREGVLKIDASGMVLFRGPSIEPVSATGAGDSFLAAGLWQRIVGNENIPNPVLDMAAGSAGAFITLKSPQTVSPAMDPEALESLLLAWNRQACGVIRFF